jgi:chromosomal replication initiator protein
MPTRSALARLLVTPENRAALSALQDLLAGLNAGTCDQLPDPLYLFGPTGSGKTQLAEALADELTRCGFVTCLLSARDLAEQKDWRDLAHVDVLIVEDMQHLPGRYVETLIGVIDERRRLGVPTIFTALHGPAALRHRGSPMPHRLSSRLAGGLVVALDPLRPVSRRRFLEMFARESKVNAAPEILDWLAEHLIGGARQLAGAVGQLKTLQALQKKPLRLDDIRAHFRPQIEAKAPTVGRIAELVSACYGVKPKLMLSARRSRDVLLPRQVSMYLARQLTNLSLQKIGRFFGGRDHKTVQHACRKVELAMKADTALSGVVRQMQADLV